MAGRSGLAWLRYLPRCRAGPAGDPGPHGHLGRLRGRVGPGRRPARRDDRDRLRRRVAQLRRGRRLEGAPHRGQRAPPLRMERVLQRPLPHGPRRPLERRYLIVPGLRSSRTYVLDTKPDPRNPQVVRKIEPRSSPEGRLLRPHTVHCGPGGIFMSNLGGANGADGPGGVALIDHDTFEVPGPGRRTAANRTSPTTSGGTSTTTSRSPRSGRHRR